ncbi:hypothetical protein DSL72_005126 [Monilinia vaccinii-corymbosi]|uniref:Uncharacterized protein n=1 Tax=Monilinia vaccinii-corymbosi TaxID=61207 RepID=A0A8A3PEJ1_9HELO|nr:hypothetical protein DSL72_005126 [Monilinia vaccinii-corymbosi]
MLDVSAGRDVLGRLAAVVADDLQMLSAIEGQYDLQGPDSQARPDDLLTAVGVSDRGERVGTMNLGTPDPF